MIWDSLNKDTAYVRKSKLFMILFVAWVALIQDGKSTTGIDISLIFHFFPTLWFHPFSILVNPSLHIITTIGKKSQDYQVVSGQDRLSNP